MIRSQVARNFLLATAMVALAFDIPCPLAASTKTNSPAWDVFSDTWVATDGLGRSLPSFEEVGGVKANRTVGIFYFLWLGSHSKDLYDITQILAVDPIHPKYGPPGAFHFWGEPLFGYYYSQDEAVLRKHAQMLADAGVDVLIFDVTNGFTYDEVYLRLCRVLAGMRKEGMRTPQIAFIAHSGEGQVVQRLYDTFYSKGLHSDLWFRWQGKPLVLASPQALTPQLRQYFTVRESWAWSNGQEWFASGQDKWPWLDHYPQTPGWHDRPENPEQIPVCVAQHPVSNIGRSFHKGRQPAPGQTAPDQGLCFAEQWRRALDVGPAFIFLTGWNEWVAQRFISEKGGQTFLGSPLPPGGTFFVDQYNQEFSRDIEPMKGGHGDNYYYQMVAHIRRYKGVRPLPALLSHPISVDGLFKDWAEVKTEFRDTLGDPVRRDHPGWVGAGHYRNQSGRNDLRLAKVSGDATNIYFYVCTTQPLTSPDTNWMLLLIDADQDPRTGWLGYDFIVNRSGVTPSQTLIERHLGGAYQWGRGEAIPLRHAGSELELSIPRSLLGHSTCLDFKWADNIQQTGDWSDFSVNGDSAPNDRYNYRARWPVNP